MRLGFAEAIRLGSVVSKRQLFGMPWDDDGGTCALWGAMAAVGLRHKDTLSIAHFPEASVVTKFNPCGCYMDEQFGGWSIAGLVRHLNDFHKWTRDQIADAVEQALAATPAPCSPIASPTPETVPLLLETAPDLETAR
jgi:hypothetical protein